MVLGAGVEPPLDSSLLDSVFSGVPEVSVLPESSGVTGGEMSSGGGGGVFPLAPLVNDPVPDVKELGLVVSSIGGGMGAAKLESFLAWVRPSTVFFRPGEFA